MGLITKYHTFVDGAGVPDAQCLAVRLNTNWDRLYTLVNGAIDQANIYTGYKLTRSGALPTFSAGTHEGLLWYDTGGDKMYYGNASAWKDGIGVTGPSGPTGPTGPTGATGATGSGSDVRLFTWIIAYPVAGIIGGPKVYEAHTIKRVSGATKDGTSVAFNAGIANEATPFTVASNVMPSDLTADSDGQDYDMVGASGENGSVSADQWIIIDINTVTGTVTQLAISIACELA
jgi:hypothetical protein